MDIKKDWYEDHYREIHAHVSSLDSERIVISVEVEYDGEEDDFEFEIEYAYRADGVIVCDDYPPDEIEDIFCGDDLVISKKQILNWIKRTPFYKNLKTFNELGLIEELLSKPYDNTEELEAKREEEYLRKKYEDMLLNMYDYYKRNEPKLCPNCKNVLLEDDKCGYCRPEMKQSL